MGSGCLSDGPDSPGICQVEHRRDMQPVIIFCQSELFDGPLSVDKVVPVGEDDSFRPSGRSARVVDLRDIEILNQN